MRVKRGVAIALAGSTFAAAAMAQGVTTISGTEGDDVLVGTAGRDALYGGGGNDQLDGGDADDQLDGGTGADVLRGGAGIDAVLYAGTEPVKVTIDGLANDGATGEGDLVADDLEAIYTGDGPDSLVGSDHDELLDGGAGDDALDGGGGEDDLYGGAGDDHINAVDETDDAIDCGDGRDLVSADVGDRLSGCETVVRAAPRRVEADVSARWGYLDGRTRAIEIALAAVPTDAIVELRCRGRGCRIKSRPVRVRRGRADAAPVLRGGRLRRGAVVEVWIVQRGAIGQVVRWRMRGSNGPSKRTLCLPVGEKRPRAC